MTSVKYLGYVVSREGMKTDPDKVKAVMEYAKPLSVSDVRSFLGLSGYYRRFIKDYGKIAKPLSDLTGKLVPWNWDDKCQQAFDSLKGKLCNAPVLSYPDYHKQFVLTTDASYEGISAVLSQVDGKLDKAICYFSRTLRQNEKNYAVTELECLALVWGVKVYRTYLLGTKFVVNTDHRALVWMNKFKDVNHRVTGWALSLSEYDFQISHRPGKNIGHADALSRHPVTVLEESQNMVEQPQKVKEILLQYYLACIKDLEKEPPSEKPKLARNRKEMEKKEEVSISSIEPVHFLELIRQKQQEDPDVLELRKFIGKITEFSGEYYEENGILYRKWNTRRGPKATYTQIVVPQVLRSNIIKQMQGFCGSVDL